MKTSSDPRVIPVLSAATPVERHNTECQSGAGSVFVYNAGTVGMPEQPFRLEGDFALHQVSGGLQ